MTLPTLDEVRVAVIGLGYVGLPLAAHLARAFPVVGFDVDGERVAELAKGVDRTREITEEEFAGAAGTTWTANPADLAGLQFLHRDGSDTDR